MTTKEMLARCQNELKQAFCALPEDVRNALLDNSKYQQRLQYDGTWGTGFSRIDRTNITGSMNETLRLSPDTPTEQEWYEVSIEIGPLSFNKDTRHYGIIPPETCFWMSLCDCVAHPNFLGIIYIKDGIETMRTSVDAAFGTPVRVRFAKESK